MQKVNEKNQQTQRPQIDYSNIPFDWSMQPQYQDNRNFPQFMPPLPPPPIFFPQGYSFVQQQQAERQQQEKLRMLLLMKKLREENQDLKMKLMQKRDEVESSYEQSSNYKSQSNSSRSQQQYKQQKRPPQGPTQEDLYKELKNLELLLAKRAKTSLNLRTRRLIHMLYFINRIREDIQIKCKQFRDHFPENILRFENETKEWLQQSCQLIIQKFNTASIQKEFILQFDGKQNQKVITKRLADLNIYVKGFILAVFDNLEKFPEYCIQFIQYFTHNYFTTPQNFLLKFEINRLKFTENGGTIVDPRCGRMMLITIIYIRMLIKFIGELFQTLPENSKQADQKINQQKQLNLQSISSAISIVAIEFLREFSPSQFDNLKQVAIEFQPKPISTGAIRIKQFNERDIDKQKLDNLKESDEPLVYPLFDKNELSPFYTDMKTLSEYKQTLDGWSEQMFEAIDQEKKASKETRKQNYEQNEKPKLIQLIQKVTIQPSDTLLYQQQQIAINDQNEKIKQIKNFLNLDTQRNTSKIQNQSKSRISKQQ